MKIPPMALVDVIFAGVLVRSNRQVSAASIVALQVLALVIAVSLGRSFLSDENTLALVTYSTLVKIGIGIVAFVQSRK
jgi:ABC-type proline/glycine betaine transport system permease subunit